MGFFFVVVLFVKFVKKKKGFVKSFLLTFSSHPRLCEVIDMRCIEPYF